MTSTSPRRLEAPRGFRGTFRDDDAARGIYAEAAGIGRSVPAAIAVPRDANDVAELVRWAHERTIPLIARGSASSMSGGAIGPDVIVDLSRLRDMGAADRDHRSIRVGAGALRGEIDRRAREVGLRFPVDPSSGDFCTIGGMVATNAAGAHSLIHGATRPWVLALDCVFSDGSCATVRRGDAPPAVPAIQRFLAGPHADILAAGRPSHEDVHKDSSGYATGIYAQSQELVDLFVGSEGTLALFTAVELALVPVAGARASLLVGFPDLDDAVEAAVRARDGGAAACELLDRTFLSIAGKAGRSLPVPADTEAALLVEVEADDAPAAERLAHQLDDRFRAIGANRVVVAADAARAEDLWAFRHAASPALAALDPRLKSMQFIEDAAVPSDRLAEYVRGVRRILADAGMEGVIFGHAGDAHVHVNPLVDVGRPDWRSRMESVLAQTTALVAHLRGTLAGEHGDGRLRTPLMERVWRRDELQRFEAIKDAFDPTRIFNPGVKVALTGQLPLDVVKYDPALPPLPSQARDGLRRIEQERGYARFRLDLL